MGNPISIHRKVLAGYYFFFAVCFAAAGVIYLFARDWMLSIIPENDYFADMTNSDFLFWGIVLFIVAGLELWIAVALFRINKVARIIAIIISLLGLVWAIFGLIAYVELFNVIFLVIHSYFLWVLFYRYHQASALT